jgi:hypothetical protein
MIERLKKLNLSEKRRKLINIFCGQAKFMRNMPEITMQLWLISRPKSMNFPSNTTR